MKILKLKLYTSKLELEKQFYSETIGFEIIDEGSNHFTVKIGWSELTFERSTNDYTYHYCFLIPSNKLMQALEWMEKRIEIIEVEKGKKTQRFESWNADSFYFYDASGNIAEFITRPDLNNGIDSEFNIADVLCVNEIGIPNTDVEKTNSLLLEKIGTPFWKGDLKIFGTNGSQEGLFLIPNYNLKEFWFPTLLPLKPEPFEAIVENQGITYKMKYSDESITISS